MTSNSPILHKSQTRKKQCFLNKLKMLLGGICCLFFTFFIVLSLPIYLFRIVVIVLAKVFRPDLRNILNGVSSYLSNDYFYNKKSPRANIVVSLYVQGREVSIEELKEVIMERWVNAKEYKTGKFEQFQQYPERWMGFTFYKSYSDTFDINDHVYLCDQPKNFVDDEDVNNICEKLLNDPYKSFISPWEVHLVKNYKSNKTKTIDSNENMCVLIFKFHHCLTDGYGILTALVEGFGQRNLKNVQLPMPRFPKRNIGQKIFYFASLPFAFIYEFSYSMSHLFRSSPWKIPDEKKEWYQHCSKSDFIPIKKVKFIKSKLDVSFTSVLLYTISSAVDKSLKNSKRKNLVTSHVKSYFEEESDVTSMYCMSVLPLPGHSGGLTNHVTMALFDLPIGNNDSVINGLQEVDHMLETTKRSVIPFAVPLYLESVGCHLYPVGNFIGKQRTNHIGLSNFPSVPFQMEENDRKCIAVDFMNGGLDGVAGVMVQLLSYGEYVRITVTAEKAVLSKDEITQFTSYIMDEIDHLYNKASLMHNDNSMSRLPRLLIEGAAETFHTSPIQLV